MKKNLMYVFIIFFIVVAIMLFPKGKTYAYHENESNMTEVEIIGAVLKPGKYTVPKGVTLAYLIGLSGGLKNNADITGLNLGMIISKNKYQIDAFEVVEEEIIVKISLNQAKYNDLIKIPNITEDRAINILLYKQEVGSFKSLEELLKVKGIGEVTFGRIKNYFLL